MWANVTHLDDFIDLVCMSPVAVVMVDARRKNESKYMHFAIHHFVVRLQCTIFHRREEGARWILCVLFRPWCVWQRLHIIYVSHALSLCVCSLTWSLIRSLSGCECVSSLDSCSFVQFHSIQYEKQTNAHIFDVWTEQSVEFILGAPPWIPVSCK